MLAIGMRMNFMVMAQYRTKFQRLATELESWVVADG